MKMMMEQKQVMKIAMTPELRQAIEILQLSTYELFQFIQQQANENPFIELTYKEEYETTYTRMKGSSSSDDDEFDPLANLAKEEKNLHEFLLEQLLHLDVTEEELNVVRYFIFNINEHGFIAMTDDEICEHLDVNDHIVKEARSIVTSLEPYGVGARDMKDCLLIQAKQHYPEDILLKEIIEYYLQDLADKRWEKIAQKLAVSLTDIQTVFRTLQTLNPRPIMNFSNARVNYITPDITIDYDNRGQLTIQLHEHYIPTLRFSQDYLANVARTTELSQYVRHQYKQFEWLQTSIEQRRSTILKIMHVIVQHQVSFFEKGFRFLKPLTLSEVAEAIDMHESTVSRATANKIIQTPVGIYELRQLFSTKVSVENNETSSRAKVKELIKEQIEKEDKYKPLSDQKIANYLKDKMNIRLSRRTVAKYREELMILSSSKRKEVKV